MFLAETAYRERTYTVKADEETGHVVVIAYDGCFPDVGEEVVLEEHFTEEEAHDLERALRDAREDALAIAAKKVG